MANFLSVLKKIGIVSLGIEKVAAPIVSSLFPVSIPIFAAIDSFVPKTQAAIISAEGTAGATGAEKSAAVVTDFESGLELVQSVLALEGNKLTYDTAALQAAINSQVTAFNSFAAVKTSFKIVKA